MVENILVAGENPAALKSVQRLFEASGYGVAVASDSSTVLRALAEAGPGLVVLDFGLHGNAGQEWCRKIRDEAPAVPIIVLSSSDDLVNKIVLLELGADDYITKPFSPRELLTRVRVALRRSNLSSGLRMQESYRFGEIEVHFGNMELRRKGKPVPLTPQEFKMLRFFVSNKERVFSRDELLNQVWGYKHYPTTRTVDTHVFRLRQKLERDPDEPVHFRTVHGAGYKFVD